MISLIEFSTMGIPGQGEPRLATGPECLQNQMAPL